MARYTGPRVRISRRFGTPIFGPTKYLERRNYGPGVHGPKARRKVTDYALGLIEKQKLRYYYGLLERQFRNVYQRALKSRGITGETMLQILETRLDSMVYNLGFANTRSAARQMICHGHIKVNGKKVNIPSFSVQINDVIEVKTPVFHDRWQREAWNYLLPVLYLVGSASTKKLFVEPWCVFHQEMKYNPLLMSKLLLNSIPVNISVNSDQYGNYTGFSFMGIN